MARAMAAKTKVRGEFVPAWKWRTLDRRCAALVLPATLLHAALPTQTEIPDRTIWLAGQLLIASPELRDRRSTTPSSSWRSIAATARSGSSSTARSTARAHRRSARAFGADATGVTDSVRVFVGGPVNPTVGFVLHSPEYRLADTVDIDGRVALTAAPEVLRDIGLRKGPAKSLVAFGYAGWAPAQLETSWRTACG